MPILCAVTACQLNVCAAMFGERMHGQMALGEQPQASIALRLEMVLYNLQHVKATQGKHGVKQVAQLTRIGHCYPCRMLPNLRLHKLFH